MLTAHRIYAQKQLWYRLRWTALVWTKQEGQGRKTRVSFDQFYQGNEVGCHSVRRSAVVNYEASGAIYRSREQFQCRNRQFSCMKRDSSAMIEVVGFAERGGHARTVIEVKVSRKRKKGNPKNQLEIRNKYVRRMRYILHHPPVVLRWRGSECP